MKLLLPRGPRAEQQQQADGSTLSQTQKAWLRLSPTHTVSYAVPHSRKHAAPCALHSYTTQLATTGTLRPVVSRVPDRDISMAAVSWGNKKSSEKPEKKGEGQCV